MSVNQNGKKKKKPRDAKGKKFTFECKNSRAKSFKNIMIGLFYGTLITFTIYIALNWQILIAQIAEVFGGVIGEQIEDIIPDFPDV